MLLASAALAVGCGGGDDEKVGLSDKSHDDFISGCTNGGAPEEGCECLYDELVKKQGIDTEDELKDLQSKVQDAASSGNVPEELRTAATNCKDKLQP